MNNFFILTVFLAPAFTLAQLNPTTASDVVTSGSISIQTPTRISDKNLTPEQVVTKKTNFESYFLIGSTLNNKTSSKVNLLGSTASSSDNDNKTITIGLDFSYYFNEKFGLGFVLDSHEYSYSSGGNNDKVLYYGLMPRYKSPINDKLTIWGGLALGYLQNRLGDSSYVLSSSYYIEAKSSTTTAFCFSPRVGLDFDTDENVKLRIQLAHTSVDLEYDFKLKNYPSFTYIGEGTYKATRTWDALSVGLSWSH